MKLVSPSEGAPAPAASAASATAQTVQAAPVQPAAAVETDGLTNTRPAAPAGAEEYILPNDLAYGEALKRPILALESLNRAERLLCTGLPCWHRLKLKRWCASTILP
jgi:hypothetical protein